MRSVLIALLAAVPLVAACDRRPARPGDAPARPAAAPAGPVGALPLARILEIAARTAPGEVVKVELEDEHGVLAYDLEIVTVRGRLIELRIDARTGAVLRREAE